MPAGEEDDLMAYLMRLWHSRNTKPDDESEPPPLESIEPVVADFCEFCRQQLAKNPLSGTTFADKGLALRFANNDVVPVTRLHGLELGQLGAGYHVTMPTTNPGQGMQPSRTFGISKGQ